jgi:protein-S-isoprenylcysteine O-methyltransferase Ste14
VVIVLAAAAYMALAAACLVQWGSPDPWSRFDCFSGSFFAAAPLWIAENAYFGRVIGRDRAVRDEASGRTYDPGMLWWIAILPLAELLVFFDYGHWRLSPLLAKPVLQGSGLLLWLVIPPWLYWADRYLGAHFAAVTGPKRILREGPFRFVRHPRYAGLFWSRIAFSLLFASAIAWILSAFWWLALRKRIRREEAHLRGLYGAEYEAYSASTRTWIP